MAKNETLGISSVRRDLVIALISSIIAGSSVIVFSNPEGREVISNWLVNATATTSLGLALIVMYRQKIYGFRKVYASLAAGLALLFIAERISMHYELAGTETFPSFADALRLVGYTFFAYHLFRSYRLSSKSVVPYWELLTSSLLINVMAYSGFIYGLTTNTMQEIGVWDLLYNASYLCIAVTLFWYNRFSIFKKKDREDSGGRVIPRPYTRS